MPKGGKRRGFSRRGRGGDFKGETKPMRVSRITVKQLFNTFDHSVRLNLASRVTIIHGLNGLGKTTLLKMVRSLCSGRYTELQAVPFAGFQIDFDDGSSVVVRKTDEVIHEGREHPKKKNRLVIQYYVNGIEHGTYSPPLRIDSASIGMPVEWLEHRIPGIERVAPNRWRYRPTMELLTLERVRGSGWAVSGFFLPRLRGRSARLCSPGGG
jgi:predicted ATPase